MNSGFSRSESSLPDIPTDAERALAAILPATHKFSDYVRESITKKQSVTYRLQVRVKAGKLDMVQLIQDEIFPVTLDDSNEKQ